MLVADAIVELLAGLLFAVVTLLMLRSLRRAGTLTWRNSLALGLVSVFAVSAPHRLLHGVRLLLATRTPSASSVLVFPEATIVDALVLVALLWYASAFTRVGRVLIPEERERFALFADQVGLHGLRAELQTVHQELLLEKARTAVVMEHLRQAAEPLEQLRGAALGLAEESHDEDQRQRFRSLAARVVVVEQLARAVG